MKKLALIGALAIAVASLLAGGASATNFTLNSTALQMLWETYENPLNDLSDLHQVTTDEGEYGTSMYGDVGFMGTLYDSPGNPYSPFAQMQIGANFWGYSENTGYGGATTAEVIGASLGTDPTNDLTGFDKYGLVLFNDNDDDWFVNIHMNTGFTDLGDPDNYYENGWTLLPSQTGATLWIDLTSVDNVHRVSNIGISVAGNMAAGSNPSNPDVFHVSGSQIPEPGVMMLLGAALVGFAGLRLRRR